MNAGTIDLKRRGSIFDRLAVVTLIVGAFLLSACSSSGTHGGTNTASGSSPATGSSTPQGDSVAQARALVKQYLDPTSQIFDYSKYIPKDKVAPKKNARIAIIAGSLASPVTKQYADSILAAVHAIGWQGTEYDGQFKVDVQSSLIEQAVTEKVDGVVLAGGSTASFPTALASAAKANIPVVAFMGYGDTGNGVTDIGVDPVFLGKEIGNWIIADSNGKATTVVFTLPPGGASSVVLNAGQSGVVNALSQCSGCKVIQQEVALADVLAPGNPAYVSFLRSHPNGSVQYIASGFDSAMLAYAKVNEQLGRTDIKLTGGVATSEEGLSLIASRSGGSSVGPVNPADFISLLVVDTIARRLDGQSVSPVYLPAPIADAANAQMFPHALFTPKTDYLSTFKALWTS